MYKGDSNHVKQFAEGNSSKTLKLLDISFSTVKLKSIKSIFLISSV